VWEIDKFLSILNFIPQTDITMFNKIFVTVAVWLVIQSVSQTVVESNIRPVLGFSISPRVDIALFLVWNSHYIVTLSIQATGFRRTIILRFALVIEVYNAGFFKTNFRFSRSITCKCFLHFTRVNTDWRKRNFLFIIGVLLFPTEAVVG
jgi:hypothetical protein